MVIISLQFAFFVIACLVIFYLLPGKAQNPFLLLASYYFYSTWSWGFAAVLLALTVFNYFYAQFVQRASAAPAADPALQQRRKWVLRTGVGVNLAVFAVFLFGGQLGRLWHDFNESGAALSLLMPVGFSYYVLECISYLIDINLKIAKPSTNFLDFALYLAYFPKRISGPIERARKFLPLLAGQQAGSEKKIVDNQAVARSLMLITVGLLQATVLAGMLAILTPGGIFDKPQAYSSPALLLGLLGYLFYLYNQFAGYTNIVRGVSGLFGIELSRNFEQPFFAQDFSDFWKRWHMSLSQWLRDYIYMPISRSMLRRNPSRTNKANLVLPPLATMLASGLWHGANLHLMVWGLINGLYVLAENLLNLYRPATPVAQKPAWRKVLSSILVLGLAMLAVIPFRLDLIPSWAYLTRLLSAWQGSPSDLRLSTASSLSAAAFIGLTLLLDWLQARHNNEFIFLKWPRWAQAMAGALALLAVVIVSNLQGVPNTFRYP